MPAIDEDDRPKKKIAHEIGQDLALLSVEELAERIALLKDEIARLEAEMAQKTRRRKSAAEPVLQEMRRLRVAWNGAVLRVHELEKIWQLSAIP